MANIVVPIGSAYAIAKRIDRQALFSYWDSLKNGAYDIGTYFVPGDITVLGPKIENTEVNLEYTLNLPQNWWTRRESTFYVMNEIRTVAGDVSKLLYNWRDRENDLAVAKWKVEHGKGLAADKYPVKFKVNVTLFQHQEFLYSTDVDRELQAAKR